MSVFGNSKVIKVVPGGPFAVETSAADLYTWSIEHPIMVTDVVVRVSVLVAADMVSQVVALDGVINSAARAEIGRVSIEEADAVGSTHSMAEEDSTWYTAFFDEGDTLYIEQVTAATDSGSVAGDVEVHIYYELIPDGSV